MEIGIYVNTDTTMSKAMLDALTRFEFQCVFTGKTSSTTEDATEFLNTEYGPELAAEFSPNFMVPAS